MPMFNEQAAISQIKKYLDLGLSPIPLKGKVANYHWKSFILTSANLGQYVKPGVNWGIRAGRITSGRYLYFVDLDRKELLSEFIERDELLAGTPIVSTAKGFHLYFTWTTEPQTRHFEGIDIIANGYVVAPPSIHPSGKEYRFIVPLSAEPPLMNPENITYRYMDNPPPIIHNFRSSKVEQAIGEGVPEGRRHNTLIRYIGILLARHYTEEETLAEVLKWNHSNRPPLSQREVSTTVRSCYERWDRYIPPAKKGIV